MNLPTPRDMAGARPDRWHFCSSCHRCYTSATLDAELDRRNRIGGSKVQAKAKAQRHRLTHYWDEDHFGIISLVLSEIVLRETRSAIWFRMQS